MAAITFSSLAEDALRCCEMSLSVRLSSVLFALSSLNTCISCSSDFFSALTSTFAEFILSSSAGSSLLLLTTLSLSLLTGRVGSLSMSGCRLFLVIGAAELDVFKFGVVSCGGVFAQNCHHLGFLTTFGCCSMLLNPELLPGFGLGSTLAADLVAGLDLGACGWAGGACFPAAGGVFVAGFEPVATFTAGEVAGVLLGVIGCVLAGVLLVAGEGVLFVRLVLFIIYILDKLVILF